MHRGSPQSQCLLMENLERVDKLDERGEIHTLIIPPPKSPKLPHEIVEFSIRAQLVASADATAIVENQSGSVGGRQGKLQAHPANRQLNNGRIHSHATTHTVSENDPRTNSPVLSPQTLVGGGGHPIRTLCLPHEISSPTANRDRPTPAKRRHQTSNANPACRTVESASPAGKCRERDIAHHRSEEGNLHRCLIYRNQGIVEDGDATGAETGRTEESFIGHLEEPRGGGQLPDEHRDVIGLEIEDHLSEFG